MARNIDDVIKRGQGYQPCCVAFALMFMHHYRGEWGNGSIRFLHCICKMLDGGMSEGTTMLTGIRALKGWWTCDENLWPTDVDLSVNEFEDWRHIPPEAWEDAKQKRIRENKILFSDWPGEIEVFKLNGEILQLLTGYIKSFGDTQFNFKVIDTEYDTAAWAQLRVYTKRKQIMLEDLFVKPRLRKLGIGSKLLQRVEQISCWIPEFSKISNEIVVPIPIVDVWLPDRDKIVRNFFSKNGYTWKSSEPTSPEYSNFIAIKKLLC